MSKQIEAMKLARKALSACHYYLIHAVYSDWQQELTKEAFTAHTALHEALEEQPAQQEPVAAECKFDREQRWVRCEIAHHNLVQSEPHNWAGYQTRLLYAAPQAQPAQQEQTQEAACKAAAAEGNRLGVKSTDALRIVAAYVNATTPQAQPAREPLTDWQPIETAPKNGFRILLYSPPVKDFSGDFHNIVIGWYVIGRIPADNHWATGLRNGGKFIGQYVHNPTHWMPLPDAPKPPTG